MDILSHFIAATLGALLLTVMVVNIPSSNVYQYRSAIEQCEKELPRNQTCEIFAKPAVN